MKKLDRRSYRVVPGRHYDTPKELWGFRSERGKGSPFAVAKEFLAANAEVLGIDVAAITAREPRIVRGLGATHVIMQQRWRQRRVHRAYVTVHIANDGAVYLVKSRAAPRDRLQEAPDDTIGEASAIRRALAGVGGQGKRVIGDPELLWRPAKARIHPAWRVRVRRRKPRSELIVYVNAETGAVVDVYDNLASATGKARVFLPNPMARDPEFVPVADDVVAHPSDASYAVVVLRGLRGNGRLDGARATTRITGTRIKRVDNDFRLKSNRTKGFEEVSAYYHVDRAVAYLEELGYTGARRIFPAPVEIDARGTTEDNSWYSPGDKTLTFGTGGVDDAEDGETVLHELGHAIQDAICPDFGQSLEAAAMGEGFGDYFAASFFEDVKAPRYRRTVMSWDGYDYEGDPPGVRRLDSPHTFESFDHSTNADEHVNGEIWSAALWEVRGLLGRETADRVIIDSHFQLDGFTTFARGARAILDANRNLNEARRQTALEKVFHRRGIGPVE